MLSDCKGNKKTIINDEGSPAVLHEAVLGRLHHIEGHGEHNDANEGKTAATADESRAILLIDVAA